MAMDQSALQSAIADALTANIPTPTTDQANAISTTAGALAAAIITCIESLTITYTTGLVAPSGGGAVTGVLTGVVIS